MSIKFSAVCESILTSMDDSEENLRIQLAYLYRIFDYYQWSDLLVTHLSVRVPNENSLLILPFGLSFNEVTPNNLIKVDFDGNIIDSPSGFNINHNGTAVHRAIYTNNFDVNCILHTHSLYGVAISNLAENFLMLDQISAMFYGKIGYHNFETLFINDAKQSKLLEDLDGKATLILKNHGLLTVGQSIAEAFWFHYHLENCCKVQVLTMSTGSKIQQPTLETIVDTATHYDKWREDSAELLFEAAKRKIGLVF